MITKKEKGITLIALVITIIVLLILAGVTLATVTGYDGILPNAKKATESYKEGVGNDQEIVDVINDLFKEYIEQNGGGHHEQSNPDDNVPIIEIDESTLGLVGYYADLNGDGQITLADDGIIYADLSKSVSSYWGIDSEEDEVSHDFGTYAYSASTVALKEYEIIAETSSVDPFGTGKGIVRVKQGTEGADRFYVMALKDVAPNGTFTADEDYWYWYKNIDGNFPDDGIEIATDNDFGQGQSRTQAMISLWNNGQYAKTINEPEEHDDDEEYNEEEQEYYSDIWVVFANANNNEATVTNKIDSSRWWVPSKSEWTAFAGNLGFYKSGNDFRETLTLEYHTDLSTLEDKNDVLFPFRGERYNQDEEGEIEAYWLADVANEEEVYGLRFDEEEIYERWVDDANNRGIRPVVMLDKDLTITEGKTNSHIGEYINLGTNPLGLTDSSENWKILYVDDNYVYAILANVLPITNSCVAAAGLSTGNIYGVGCPGGDSDAQKFVDRLLNTEYWKSLGGTYSTNVIGTPTREMIYNAILAINTDIDVNNPSTISGRAFDEVGLNYCYWTSTYIETPFSYFDDEIMPVCIYWEENSALVMPVDESFPSLRLTTRY